MKNYFSFASLLVVASIAAIGCNLTSAITKSPINSSPSAMDGALFDQSELSPKKAAEACIVTAEKLESAGHHREAIGLYEKARQHNPKAIDYSRRLAVLYDKQGDIATAGKEYVAAVDRDPENADLLNDYGYFHLQQGDLAAAESSFRKALSIDDSHQRAQTNLGIALARQARYQEAFEQFAKVVGPAAAHSNVGAIMAKQGRIQEAQHAFQQALSLNPSLRQPQAFLAYYAQQVGTPSVIPANHTEQ